MKLHTVRLELRPGRADAWPMRAMPDWDQLRGFVPPFEHLDVARERLTMCVDLLPVAPRRLVPLRRRILSGVRRREMRDSLVTIHGVSDWVMPAENIERQVERQGLMAKVGRSDPFFRVQVLICASSPSRERARELVERTYAAWEQFSGQNYMRSVGTPVLGLWFLGSNAPWRRSWFDLRSRTGLHTGRRLLTARELAGLLKPWTRHCPEAIVARRERELPPPEHAASTGMVICEAEGRAVALAGEDARFHVQVVGPTGTGKSTLLANLVLARIELGLASVVIDPGVKGDVVRRDLLPRIPERDWDRVVVLDPALGRERPLGLNVLENASPEQHELIADQVTYVFRSLFHNSWGARMDDVMHTSLLTLLRRPGSTLCDLPQLLLDDEARRRWTRGLDDPLGLELVWREWSRLSESERNQRCGPILARLRTVLMRQSVRNLLGQPRSTIDLGRILDEGGVLLVALPAGELGPGTSSLLGALLVARIWQTVQARSSRPEQERPDALLVIDEAHRVVRLPQLEEILVEARSLRLGLLLGHQHMGQLRAVPELKAAIGANVHTRVAFQCEEDAAELAPWMRPLAAADLAALRQYEVAVRLCVAGHSEPAFTGMTRPPAPDLGPRHAARLTAASLERWGRPRADVEAEMLERYRAAEVAPEEDEWA